MRYNNLAYVSTCKYIRLYHVIQELKRVYYQLFVDERVSYLRYVCLFVYSGVQHILCCVLLCFSSPCMPYVVSFSVLYIFDCPICFL